MTYRHLSVIAPGIGVGSRRATASNDDRRSPRFVTQSHALGTPIARPASLLIAAAVAVAILVIGLRLSGD